MILGIRAGREWRRVELGEGSSERGMASAEASSKRRERRVETECRAKPMMRRRMSRKTRRERRMVGVRGGFKLWCQTKRVRV